MPADPSTAESRAEVLLREALTIFAPLARALISHGVTYPVFVQALKSVFLQAAHAELEREQRRITDSALSLLSGVHRKDVRALAGRGPPVLSEARRANLSMAALVFARWIRDPEYAGPDGQPLPLPIRAAAGASFEALAQSVSKDFHARSVLDELLRLRLVETDDGVVRPCADQFTPAAGFAELAYYFGANVRDHLAAGAANLRAVHDGDVPSFLEHAMFADGLSQGSVDELQDLARAAWKRVMAEMFSAARSRVDADAATDAATAAHRIRFGAFFFSEPGTESGEPSAGEPGDNPRRDGR